MSRNKSGGKVAVKMMIAFAYVIPVNRITGILESMQS